jgi:hypothetical protein
MARVRNLWAVRRSSGWRGVVDTVDRRLRPHSRRIYLFALREPRPAPDAVAAAATHVTRFATGDELRAIHARGDTTLSDNDLRAAERGDRCLLQLDGDALVGYAWIAGSPLVYIAEGFYIRLPDDTIYNYKAWTNPAYRGYGFQALRHLRLLEATASEGVRQLFGYVDAVNFNSLHGVAKSGYERVGELRVTRRNGHVRVGVRVTSDMWCDIRQV